MHLFLTGEIHIGKSTLRRRLISSLGDIRIGGFISVQQADVPGAKGSVYLMPPSCEDGPFLAEYRVRIMRREHPELFPEVFEKRGIELLSDAQQTQLILMDEIGKTEANAPMFCDRIAQLLDGNTPILGVLRLEGDTPLQQLIRNHPNVKIVEVTKENRNELFDELLSLLKDILAE